MVKKKKAKEKEEVSKKPVIKAEIVENIVITEKSDVALELYNQSRYGALLKDKLQLSLVEALFLLEKGRLEIKKGRKLLDFDSFVKIARRLDKRFLVRYYVFKDMRNRGYIVKTALKFGADFRVYDRGIKPGEDHAKWVLFPVNESEFQTWQDFSAKNRVATSTRKRLLIGIMDDENDVTYYEIKWTRP